MMRWLFVFSVVALVVWWIRHKPETVPEKQLLRCAQCGVLFPESEAYKPVNTDSLENEVFCSKTHLQEHRRVP
jgi:hypothetical protein